MEINADGVTRGIRYINNICDGIPFLGVSEYLLQSVVENEMVVILQVSRSECCQTTHASSILGYIFIK